MNRKISRNKKQVLKRRNVGLWLRRKHSRTNTYCPGGWQQHFFELLQNLRISNLLFIILKCFGFCLLVTFVILLLLYTQMFWYCSFHGYKRKEKSNFKSQANPPIFQPPPPSRNPHTISFWYFFQPPLLIHTPHLLETLEYVFRACVYCECSRSTQYVW